MKSNELILNNGEPTLIHEVVRQVIKDFDSFQLDLAFSGQTEKACEEMLTQISGIIGELAKTNPGKCTSLLYRIDLAEEVIADALNQPDFPEVIAKLIIQRELQKVLLRNHYKMST